MSRANPRFHRANAPLPSLSQFNAFRVQPSGVIDGQLWLIDMDYIALTNVAPNANAESNLATNWIAAMGASFRGCLANDVQWTQVKVTCLTITTRVPFINNTAAALGFGTGGATHIPSEMAAIVSKVTFTKGQHGRGRMYLPGVPNAFVTPATDPNRLNVTGQNAIGAFIVALTPVISDGTSNYGIGVTQRTRGGAAASNGQVCAPNGLIERLLLGTVRRRRLGRGK